MKYFFLLLMFCTRMVCAADAASCIELGTTAKGQSMKNTCAEQIVVFWCHDHDQQGYRSDLCGTDKRFYKLNRLLKPGEINDNQYSLPAHAHILHGACFGDYSAYKYTDAQGGYLCKPPKGASGDAASMMTSTAAAPMAEEACKRAQQIASEHGTPGQCACQTRGQMHLCRVQSNGLKPEGSALDSAIGAGKKKIQEVAKCKPEEKACKPADSKNVGIGVKG